jgi:hypothetical protein
VLKFRDEWAPFEREKLLPQSYNHACWDASSDGGRTGVEGRMTQKRLSNLVFSGVLVAVTGIWLWFLFAHADQIFRATQYLSRESE